jgi:hypothetical protein
VTSSPIDPISRRNDELHRRAAARIRADASVVASARELLERWIAQEGAEVDPVLLEWRAVFDFLDTLEIADFLESAAPFASRLRTSSPFLALRHDGAVGAPAP